MFDSHTHKTYTVAGSYGTVRKGYNMRKINIYFAGSIRGGRDDAALYAHIVEELGKYGTVLTEHVGDVALATLGEDGKSDKYIYNRDVKWLSASDLLVAEVTTPSLGVGYEICKAEQYEKMVLCLYRPAPGRKLSAMVAGNPYVQIEHYQGRDDLNKLFKDYFLE